MNRRRQFVLALGASVFATPRAFALQTSPKIPHIVYLSQGAESTRGAFLAAFKDALRDLGWTDGKNIVVETQWAPAREFPAVAAAVVKRNPAAIVGTCIPSTRAAKNATSTIPVVMSVNGDPVGAGLVASLAHP